jgi:Holliday junction resolvase RusA-like endonuclease
MIQRLTIVLPGIIPPSVNHYKVPVSYHGHLAFKVTPAAKAFKRDLAVFARGDTIAPASEADRKKVRYSLRVIVFLGSGNRGDGDNFFKCVADGLEAAGVIHSDASIKDWHCYVRRDADNPRTVITVKAIL